MSGGRGWGWTAHGDKNILKESVNWAYIMVFPVDGRGPNQKFCGQGTLCGEHLEHFVLDALMSLSLLIQPLLYFCVSQTLIIIVVWLADK